MERTGRSLISIPVILLLIVLFTYHWSNLANGADDKARNAVFVAALFVLIGHMFNKLIPLKEIYSEKRFSHEKLVLFGVVFMLAGTAAHLYFYSENLGQIMQYRDNYLLTRGKGYLVVFFDWLPLGILMCMQANQGMKKKSLALVCFISIMVYTAFYLFVLMKRKQLLLLFIGILIIKYEHIKNKKLIMFVLASAAYAFLMIFGQVRGFYDAHGLLETFEYIGTSYNSQWIMLDSFEGRYTSMILSDIISYTDQNGIQPWIILADFMVVIPRALWPSKLMTLSEWYSYTFHPSLYERGGAYASSLIAEAYFALSWVGIVLVFFVVGFLCSKADMVKAAGYNVAYSVVIYMIFLMPRLGGSSLIIYAVFLLFPSWLTYRFSREYSEKLQKEATAVCKNRCTGVQGHEL
ncbi:MAG: O-antigen polysaccharide polymerase Wzy [Peptococcaceae bacterium]|jgi:hypothetical protein|nr:O-antigen polysaccharide polymerase Wzy family protein [Peptococcaceae bacterium]MDH7524534.1 O-antigen polysaccharide polymerase Wzy [Peptococcaceae bacterium]